MEIEHIPEELVAAYIDGLLTNDEAGQVTGMLGQDLFLLEEYLLAARAAAYEDALSGGTTVNGSFIAGVSGAAASVGGCVCSVPFMGDRDVENNFVGDDRFSISGGSMEVNSNQLNLKDMGFNIIGSENPIQQHGDTTCAIKAQQIILQEFGIPVTEEQLVQFSVDNGLFNGNGTAPEHVGILLNQGGIPTTTMVNANIFDLTSELAQGHKVIVGVDSGELWERGIAEWWEDLWGDGGADHALIVAGIDNTDPANPQVLLTDPGSGDLCKRYPLDQFMDAWQDSHCMMVSTDISPVDFANQQVQYDQPSMHLASVGGNSYGDFQLFHDMAGALPDIDAWDYLNDGLHPVGSLVDAYMAYGQEGMDLQTVMGGDYHFVNYIDPSLFVQEYVETLHSNMELITNNPLFPGSDISNLMSGDAGVDVLQDYFASQAAYFEELGEHTLSDFFEQQVHVNELCQDLNINPLDIYMHI